MFMIKVQHHGQGRSSAGSRKKQWISPFQAYEGTRYSFCIHFTSGKGKEAGESINSDPIIEAVKSIFDINDEIVMLNKYTCEEYFTESKNTKQS